jgi:hypothetical protein
MATYKGKHAIKGVKINRKTNQVEVDVDIDFMATAERANRAQYLLDSQIMDDMVPFMPMRDGLFIAQTRARSQAIAGTGQVVAAAPPFARVLYEGKVMIDPLTGSPWARKGAKKVGTDRPLKYSKESHPQAQAHWFEATKRKNLNDWVKLVDRTMNK